MNRTTRFLSAILIATILPIICFRFYKYNPGTDYLVFGVFILYQLLLYVPMIAISLMIIYYKRINRGILDSFLQTVIYALMPWAFIILDLLLGGYVMNGLYMLFDHIERIIGLEYLLIYLINTPYFALTVLVAYIHRRMIKRTE